MGRRLLFPLLLLFLLNVGFSQEYRTVPNSLDTVRAQEYLRLLQQEYAQGNYKGHKAYSDSLFVHSESKGIIKFQVLGMVNQAIAHNNLAESDKAISKYRAALQLLEDTPQDYRSKIIVLVNLGNVYTKIEAYEKAIKTMKDVLAMLDAYEDNPKIRASALNGLADNHERLGQYNKALDYHLRTKALAETIGDEAIMATAMNKIANVHKDKGSYQKASETLMEALALDYAKRPTKERVWLLLSLGDTEQKMGKPDKAIALFEEAKTLAQTKGLLSNEMEAYKYLSEVYSFIGDSISAGKAKEAFLTLKGKTLEEKQQATKIDLEQDISENQEVISLLNTKKKNLLFWSITLLSILVIVSLLFFMYGKRTQKEHRLLQEKFLEFNSSLATNKASSTLDSHPLPSKIKTRGYRKSTLTQKDLDTYKQRLTEHMITQKPFLNHNLSQSDLAQQLDMSSHHLSELLNTVFGQNFYNFMNNYKIVEAQRLMMDKKYKDAKIIAIAFDSGFKSKTSFNRVFKNHTGLTPSQFRQQLNC